MNNPTRWHLPLLCTMCVCMAASLSTAQAQSSPATFTSAGHTISVDWYHAATAGTHPVIVYLYGMDGMLLFPQSYSMMGSWFASQGYDVFVIHYFDRTGTVFADPFTVFFSYTQWMQTIGDGMTWVSQQPTTDPKRIGLMGISLGSFLALSVAEQNSNVKTVVEFSGSLLHSPTHLPPTLIIHGALDPLVPVASAYQLAQTLQTLGVPYQIQVYPNEGHMGFQLNDEFDAMSRSLTFFNQYLH